MGRRMSRGQMTAQVSDALVRFEKEYMGRGPLEVKTYLVDDMVLVRLQGVLTRAELQLVQSSDSVRGRDLVKELRVQMLEMGRPQLEAVLEGITGRKVVSMHTDVSTVTGERVILFSMASAPDVAET
jgi:uncharacterized protein YbcI